MSGQQDIITHITTSDITEWQTALRNLRNLVKDESVSTPPDRMRVVVNGPGVRFLLSSSPEADRVAQMAQSGVTVSVCSNSLSRFGHDPANLATGVETVESGVAAVVRSQKRGSSYLKLP